MCDVLQYQDARYQGMNPLRLELQDEIDHGLIPAAEEITEAVQLLCGDATAVL